MSATALGIGMPRSNGWAELDSGDTGGDPPCGVGGRPHDNRPEMHAALRSSAGEKPVVCSGSQRYALGVEVQAEIKPSN
jgi:hypothetical protein